MSSENAHRIGFSSPANAARGIAWGINRKGAGAFAAAGWGEARGRGKNPMGGRLGAANRGGHMYAYAQLRVLRKRPLVASSVWNIGSLEHNPRWDVPRLSLLNRSGR